MDVEDADHYNKNYLSVLDHSINKMGKMMKAFTRLHHYSSYYIHPECHLHGSYTESNPNQCLTPHIKRVQQGFAANLAQ